MPLPFSLIFSRDSHQKQPAHMMDDDDMSDDESVVSDFMDLDQPEPFYKSNCDNSTGFLPRHASSVAESLSLSSHSSTLLPNRLAKIVSTVSKSSTMSLRLSTYIASTLLDSARIGTLTSLGFTRRAIEGILYKADQDTENAESWTQSGMGFVNRAATLAQLFTAASFHLMSTSLQTTSGFAQDSVHLLDAVFGSTESSRAIAAIIALIRRELGDGAGLYSLVSALTCFSILQSKGWHRTMEEIEMHIVWDVVVLETGETLSQQFPGVPETTNDTDEDVIVASIPNDVAYRVAVTEVKTKTVAIEISGNFDIPKFKLPDGASIVHEESKHLNENDTQYTLTFQKSSRVYRERKGISPNNKEVIDLPIPDPTDIQIQPQQPEYLNDGSDDDAPDLKRPMLETILSDTDEALEQDALLGEDTPPLNLGVTRSLSDSSLTSSFNKFDTAHKHSESLDLETLNNSQNKSSPNMKESSDRQPSFSTFSFPRSKSFSSLVPPPPNNDIQTVGANNINNNSINGGSNNGLLTRVSFDHSSNRNLRRDSVCTIKSENSESDFRYNSYCASGLGQQQVFPPGHITQNMYKYMRFATASYGQSFMHVLGIGKVTSTFTPNDSNHHSEHYAFAAHTKLGLENILLSSYSDSAVDNKSGIPLVHFVSIDHQAKAVVLTIRGTLGLEDILTDLTCDYEVMEWHNKSWKVHGGMLKCAQILKRQSSRVLKTIIAALEKWGPEYGLVICGHSLGGGVGALFGILLSEMDENGTYVTSKTSLLPPGRRIHCFAYGPPASMSAALRRTTRSLITTVVYGLDMVPCLSLGLLRDFQSVAVAFKNDKQGVVNEIKRRFLSQLASRHNPLSVNDADDDYLWSVLKTLRAVMQSEKLVPPGEIYSISTSTVFETHDGKTKRATRIIGKVVFDVEKRFGEPAFGRGIFHHSPVYYEQALRTLEMGVCNAPV